MLDFFEDFIRLRGPAVDLGPVEVRLKLGEILFEQRTVAWRDSFDLLGHSVGIGDEQRVGLPRVGIDIGVTTVLPHIVYRDDLAVVCNTQVLIEHERLANNKVSVRRGLKEVGDQLGPNHIIGFRYTIIGVANVAIPSRLGDFLGIGDDVVHHGGDHTVTVIVNNNTLSLFTHNGLVGVEHFGPVTLGDLVDDADLAHLLSKVEVERAILLITTQHVLPRRLGHHGRKLGKVPAEDHLGLGHLEDVVVLLAQHGHLVNGDQFVLPQLLGTRCGELSHAISTVEAEPAQQRSDGHRGHPVSDVFRELLDQVEPSEVGRGDNDQVGTSSEQVGHSQRKAERLAHARLTSEKDLGELLGGDGVVELGLLGVELGHGWGVTGVSVAGYERDIAMSLLRIAYSYA